MRVKLFTEILYIELGHFYVYNCIESWGWEGNIEHIKKYIKTNKYNKEK